MVLAVYIVGNGSANRNELGAGRYRQKPATRHHDLQNLGQRDSGFAAQQARLFIKGDETLQMTDIERDASRVEATIAIAASISEGQRRILQLPQIGELVAPVN